MTIQRLPIESNATAFRTSIAISNEGRYIFDFRWLSRLEGWYFDMLDADESYQIRGVRVVLGYPLLTRLPPTEALSGMLVAVRVGGENRPLQQYELGEDVVIYYVPPEDMPETSSDSVIADIS